MFHVGTKINLFLNFFIFYHTQFSVFRINKYLVFLVLLDCSPLCGRHRYNIVVTFWSFLNPDLSFFNYFFRMQTAFFCQFKGNFSKSWLILATLTKHGFNKSLLKAANSFVVVWPVAFSPEWMSHTPSVGQQCTLVQISPFLFVAKKKCKVWFTTAPSVSTNIRLRNKAGIN